MIHLVSSATAGRYIAILEEMHRLRRDFYIGERKWAAMREIDGKEYDCFDDDRALYFVALASNGAVMASARLRPTDDKSLLADFFPHLVADGNTVSYGSDVWEMTRLMVSPQWRGPQSRRLRDELRIAILEAAVARGIKHMNVVADTFFLPAMRAAGWPMRLLGLAQPYAEGDAVAVEIRCSAEDVRAMRERAAIYEPVLLDIERLPFPADVDPLEADAFLRLVRALPAEKLNAAVQILRSGAEGGDGLLENATANYLASQATNWT